MGVLQVYLPSSKPFFNYVVKPKARIVGGEENGVTEPRLVDWLLRGGNMLVTQVVVSAKVAGSVTLAVEKVCYTRVRYVGIALLRYVKLILLCFSGGVRNLEHVNWLEDEKELVQANLREQI